MDDHIAVRAPAKINLSLDVLGRRPDGYHALRSVMQTLELHDMLDIAPASEIALDCDVPALAGPSNLVWRAAALLRDATGYAGGARLALRKRIPVDAGLGGGSSDAAATLLGLNRLWELNLSTEALAEMGARLGSDVPFFFYAPTALVTGRGETVEPLPPLPLPLPRTYVVLYKPPVGVSTRKVFAALTPALYSDGAQTDDLLAALGAGMPPTAWPLANDLQRTVCTLYPDVAHALDDLRAAGAPHPIMTGSGSTVYALFADEADARRAHERLPRSMLTSTVVSRES